MKQKIGYIFQKYPSIFFDAENLFFNVSCFLFVLKTTEHTYTAVCEMQCENTYLK